MNTTFWLENSLGRVWKQWRGPIIRKEIKAATDGRVFSRSLVPLSSDRLSDITYSVVFLMPLANIIRAMPPSVHESLPVHPVVSFRAVLRL
jgi:hypothetical protein